MYRRRIIVGVALALMVGVVAGTGAGLAMESSAVAPFEEEAKLTASDAPDWALFGIAVALDGDTASIGAEGGGDDNAGSVALFTRSGTTWTEQQVLVASDGAAVDLFGVAVALQGDTMVVGARGDDDGSGSAYIFTQDADTWTEQQKLTASDATPGAQFGVSVAMEGDTLAVGAVWDSQIAPDAGAVYVFTREGSIWTEQQKLTASDGDSDDRFGRVVALDGNTLAVGAHGDGPFVGAVYVFTLDGETWTEQQKLTASDGSAHNEFGWALALQGDTLLVGAPTDFRGSVYVFTYDGETWDEQQKLTAPGPSSGFGSSVALQGDTALVTSNDPAYVFTWDGETWSEQQRLTAPGATDAYAGSVALSGNRVVIGVPYDDDNGENTGSAYVFHSPTPLCNEAEPTIVGTEDPDTLIGTDGPDVIFGLGGDDIIRGLGGDDILCGGEGDDLLNGGPGNDQLYGEAGDDRLIGQKNDDLLDGGPGSDLLNGLAGDDTLNGGWGIDQVSFAGATAPVTLDLAAGTATGIGNDTIRYVENAKGTPFDDTLQGNDLRNILRGGGGDDTLVGRGGNDMLVGRLGDDTADGGAGTDRCNAETRIDCER